MASRIVTGTIAPFTTTSELFGSLGVVIEDLFTLLKPAAKPEN